MKTFKVRIQLAEIVYTEIVEEIEATSTADAYAQVSKWFRGMNHKILSGEEEQDESLKTSTDHAMAWLRA